jgi:hypothetical protein
MAGNTLRQANKPWIELWLDFVLIGVALFAWMICLTVDWSIGEHEWFQRSGAIMVVCAGLLGYQSLERH